MQDHYQLILCTCPNEDSAQTLANHLVDKGLAACINILPGVLSVYRWQGKRENAHEHMLIIKTVSKVYDKLEKAIIEKHPYELPEIIAVPIRHGSEAYLDWIDECVIGTTEVK